MKFRSTLFAKMLESHQKTPIRLRLLAQVKRCKFIFYAMPRNA